MPPSTEARARRNSKTPVVVRAAAFTKAARVATLTSIAAFLSCPAAAQVVFDGTLGTAGAAPVDPASGYLRIDAGRGQTVASGGRTHLFHSFSQFDVGTTDTVEFRAADTVHTILSRITDSGPSSIAGDLRVRTESGTGAPDLFLLNPNGILFNGSSRLDLSGAFVASSAEAVGFLDGTTFSAVDVGAPLPTTATAPSALRFGAVGSGGPGGAGAIEFENGRVQTFEGTDRQKAVSLTFVGRSVEARGLGGVIADDATVQIAAVGSGALDVPLHLTALPARGTALGAVQLDGDTSTFSVQTNSALTDQGRVVIRGGELVLRSAQILSGGDGSAGADTVAIDVGIDGTVQLSGSSARIDSRSSAAAGPGGLRITAGRVDVESGASIGMTQNGDASGSGRLAITADAVSLDGAFAEIKTTVNGGGAGGDIEIEADLLELSNDARLLSEVLAGATGAGGDIAVDAEVVRLGSLADVLSVTAIGSGGDGGDIDVRSESIALDGFSRILAGSAGDGVGGDITIDGGEIALGEGAFVATGPLSNPAPDENFSGAAGTLRIDAHSLSLRDGAQVSTTTDGDGPGGDLILRIDAMLEIESSLAGGGRSSGLFAGSGLGPGSTATGQGGSIDLEAGQLSLRDGAQIRLESTGSGNSGSAALRVGTLSVSGDSAISASAIGSGATGAIRIEATGDIVLGDGGAVRSAAVRPPNVSSPAAPPDAGDIEIRAGGRLLLTDAEITTESTRVASGNISLAAGRATALVDSEVSTRVESNAGSGGNITIDAPVLAVAGGGVRANATGSNGEAGDIVVRASEGIVLLGGGVLEARADRGIAGEVVLAGPETNLAGELAGLSARRQTAQDSVRDPCAARRLRSGSFDIVPLSAEAESETGNPPPEAARRGCGRR